MIKIHVPTEQFGFLEIDADNIDDAVKKYIEAKNKILQSKLDKNGFSIQKLTRIVNSISIGSPMSVEDYESLTTLEQPLVDAVKRAYNRSSLAKSKVVNKPKK